MNNEVLIWKGKPSQLQNLGPFILCFIFSWLFIPVPIAIWLFLKTATTKFEVTNKRLLVSRGILNRITEEIAIYKVIDTQMEEPLLYRLVGLSSIKFFVVGDRTTSIVFVDGIKNGRSLQDEVRKYSYASESIMDDVMIDRLSDDTGREFL